MIDESGIPTEESTPSPSLPGTSPSATSSAVASATASVSASPSASPSATGPPGESATISVVVPPESLVSLTPNSQHILLRGTTRALTPGQTIELTLVFERSGRMVVRVPIGVPPEGVTRRSPDEEGKEEPHG